MRTKKPIGIISATDTVAYVRENIKNVATKISSEVVEALESEGTLEDVHPTEIFLGYVCERISVVFSKSVDEPAD